MLCTNGGGPVTSERRPIAWLIRFRGRTRSSSAAAREAPGIPGTLEAMGIAESWLYGLGPQDYRKPSTAGTHWNQRGIARLQDIRAHANGPCRGRQTIRVFEAWRACVAGPNGS